MTQPYPSSVPPGEPIGDPPGYPAPPPAGQPLDAGYPLAPPAFPENPPAKKKRTGLKIALAVVAVVLVLCVGGIVAAIVAPGLMNKDYPSTLTAPNQLAGLTKLTDPTLQQTADELATSLKTQTKASNTIAAYYAPGADKAHLVAVWGVTARLSNPASQVDAAFKGAGSSGIPISNVHAVPAGSLGGTAKCGNGTTQGVPLTLCFWGDGGSLGGALFFNRTADESAPLFLSIREAVLHRG